MKRIAALLLAVVMVFGVGIYFPDEALAADVAWTYGGSGTATSPYIIDTAEEFSAFMTNVTNGSAYLKRYFRVDKDIVYNEGYTFTFDEASGLVKVANSSGTALFCLGTGTPGTARHRGYVSQTVWEEISVPGKTYTVGSLTGALAATTVSVPLSSWAFNGKDVSFAGTLDFNGHSISGVYVNGAVAYTAIFGKMKAGATIKNMTVKNSFFCGENRTAAIASFLQSSAKLLNCVNEATVCSNGTVVGGIVAYSEAGANPTIVACENKGHISARYVNPQSSSAIAGGVIGQIRGGSVIACKNSGTVFSQGSYACGGIIGLLDSGGQNNAIIGSNYIYACINTGKVDSFFNNDQFNNVESTQYHLSGAPVGGIVGYLDPFWSNKGTEIEVRYCLNTGSVREGLLGSAGDIIGKGNAVYSANHYNGPCSVTIRITDNVSVNDSSYAALPNANAFSGIYVYTTIKDNEIIKTGALDKKSLLTEHTDKANTFLAKLPSFSYIRYDGNDMIPVGYGNNIYDKYGFADFKQDGSAEDPVIIDSAQDLKDLRDAVNGGKSYDGVHFAIVEDIDLSSEANWTPIGNAAYGANPSVYFGGKLYGAKPDGTPAVIKGLKINSTDTSTKQNAFIGINLGEVSNIVFEDASVSAKRYAAIIVGENLGVIKNCATVNSSVTLSSHVAPTTIGNENAPAPAGGICAVNLGTIDNCKNGANVTSNYSFVGGITGSNLNSVSYCTNYGKVIGNCTVGGISGYLGGGSGLYGTVKYSGNLGEITATGSHVAGVVGWSRDAGGIMYCFNGGKIVSTAESSNIGSYSEACVSGILGCGNANNLNCGNSYIVAYCHNTGDIYNADKKKTSNDIAGWVASYTSTRLLKASTGKSDASKGIYDGVYVKIDGVDYTSVPHLEQSGKMSYDKNKELLLKSAAFSSGGVKLTFSEPVKSISGVYAGLRFCRVNESGIPALAWADTNGDGAADPLQINLGLKVDDTNAVTLTFNSSYNISGAVGDIVAAAIKTAGFEGLVDDCVPLICIEGLEIKTEGYKNLSGVIDGIGSAENPLSFVGNYGIYSQYAVGNITQADAKSGALCEFLNKTYGTSIFTQNVGVEICPVINGDIDNIKLERNIDGTYTVPALVGSVANEGSLVGYRAADGKVYGAGDKIAYEYVSPVYESALVLDYGAAVRVGSGDVTGLRWSAKINKKAISEYTIVEKGFIIAPTAYVTGEWAVVNNKNVKAKKVAADFTEEAFKAVDIDYIKVAVTGFTDLAGTEFAASVSNLYKENFSLGYSARAYIDLKDASGNVKRIYSGFKDANGRVFYSYAEAAPSNSRAPGEIAKKALADLAESSSKTHGYKIYTSEDAFLKANGYTAQYYYSPYSYKARENLYNFILTLPAEPSDEKIFYPKYDNAEEYAPMRAELEKWIRARLNEGTFFSAEVQNVSALGGFNSGNSTVSFDSIRSSWSASAISEKTEKGNKILTRSYNYATAGLKFTTTVILYGDTPTADVKTVVENTSTTKRSAVLKNFYAIDASFQLAKAGGDINLTTLVGSYAKARDFDMVERNLTTEFVQPVLSGSVVTNQHSVFYTTTSKGFSSSGDGFPYFDLVGDNKGVMMAIGWSGQWEGSFKKDTAGNAILRARQQYLSTYLEPGEKIEAPRIVLTYFEGDREYGHNIWREMMLSHYTPDNDNDPDNENNFVAPIPANFWGGTHHETVKISVEKYMQKGAPIDIIWFDAGWYGPLLNSVGTAAFNANDDPDVAYDSSQADWNTFISKNPKLTFNWTGWIEFRGEYVENRYLFPNGLEEIGKLVDDTAAKYGKDLKFMLWYMIHDRHVSHSNYSTPGGTKVVTTGTTDIKILTDEEVAQYKSKYPNLADLEEKDYLSKTLNDTKGNYGTSTGVWKLDLSQEAVLNKIIDYYKYMKDVKGVDAIRLDNANGPLAYWRANDLVTQKDATGIKVTNTEDGGNFYRQGYTENKWTLNEYRLWDALKAHSAEFFLDNTASGGRRLDIELARRSMSLWRTDWNNGGEFFNEAHQKMTQTLSLWIPLSTVGVAGADDYAARSYYSASVCVTGMGAWDTSDQKDANGNYLQSDSYEANATRIVNRAREIADLRPYWYGNYYQLLPVTTDYTSWQSYELYREDWDEGMFVVICRPETTQTEDPTGKTLTKTVKLKGLDSCATYRIHNIDDVNCDADIYASGAELMTSGVTVTSSQKKVSAYKIILVD